MDNLLISIGRQLGSGGCEIAGLLAKEFGCKYYDRELINLAAERIGFNPKVFERNDEVHGPLRTLLGSYTARIGRLAPFYDNAISQENLFRIQSEAMWKAAEAGPCVFVGRCADYVLRKKPMLFSVFITASEEERIKTVATRMSCDNDTARKYIARKEAQRAQYYNYYTSKQWGAANSYDLCINASLLGKEATAALIANIIRQRFPHA